MEPKQTLKPFGLRLEPELKNWLQQEARRNKRSLNGEIEYRLEAERRREERPEAA